MESLLTFSKINVEDCVTSLSFYGIIFQYNYKNKHKTQTIQFSRTTRESPVCY